jgi:hypothetical protein
LAIFETLRRTIGILVGVAGTLALIFISVRINNEVQGLNIFKRFHYH